MTTIALRCRQCGGLEDLISIIEIGHDLVVISNLAPKQRSITDPKKAAICHKHGEVWCWACWSAQYPGAIPNRIEATTGRVSRRGESPRGGHA
jgi:hypothetical protein